MCGQTMLQNVMSTFTNECRVLFGEKLNDVRLFGSYARGDFNDDSDIDVMVIVDMDYTEAKKYLEKVCEIAFEIDSEINTIISPIIRSRRDYEIRKELPGFYRNVELEGVSMNV